MVAIRDETIGYGTIEGARVENLASLAQLWSKSGWHLERLVSKWQCVVGTCTTIAFVALKTTDGRKSVCLKHFEEIGSQAGIRAPRIRVPV
ncbi:MAG TPA: hypothetical protein VJB57_07005 [Dehalococcoidia bacterium]|nr:hypothetical protein [Dehalococcoidia bacterium]